MLTLPSLTLPASWALFALFALSSLGAQTPALPELPEPDAQAPAPNLEDVIQRMADTVRTEEAPKRLEGFRAELWMKVSLEKGDTAILRPTIWFKPPLQLRVEFDDNGKKIIYVRNGRQLWMHNGQSVIDLANRQKEYERDREDGQAANQYLRVAQLVPRLVFPDRSLAAAPSPSAPEPIVWRIGAKQKPKELLEITYRTAEGESYYLQSRPDYDGPQQLTMLVDRDSFAPYAYRYHAIDPETGKKTSALEDLIFLEPTRKSGLLLPTHWVKRVEDPNDHKMKVAQEWKLGDFEANPDFAPDTFAKPR